MTDQKPKPKQSAITFRADEDLLTAFKNICDREGYSQTLILRELIKKYVKQNGQADFFK